MKNSWEKGPWKNKLRNQNLSNNSIWYDIPFLSVISYVWWFKLAWSLISLVLVTFWLITCIWGCLGYDRNLPSVAFTSCPVVGCIIMPICPAGICCCSSACNCESFRSAIYWSVTIPVASIRLGFRGEHKTSLQFANKLPALNGLKFAWVRLLEYDPLISSLVVRFAELRYCNLFNMKIRIRNEFQYYRGFKTKISMLEINNYLQCEIQQVQEYSTCWKSIWHIQL